MKFLVAVVACLVVAINGAPSKTMRPIFPNGKIVGGNDIDITAVPHQVALESTNTGYLFCGGSIISENYVLTAASCTDGSTARSITVRFGTTKLESGGSTTKVSSIAQNPGFTQNNLDYDVSILKLLSPIELSDSAQPITLSNAEAAEGDTAQVSGWGPPCPGGGGLASTLQAVNVPVLSRARCKEAYGSAITARMFCAGEAGKGSCQGDSGGAISVDGKQVGVVSWGIGCAEERYPAVYSNVAASALKNYINDNSNNEATWG